MLYGQIQLLTYSLTWQTDHCSPWRLTLKTLLNAKTPRPALAYALLKAYCSKKLPKRTNTQLRVVLITDQLHAWAPRRSTYAQLSSSLYPYVTHVIYYTRPSPAFPYCKRWKAGWGLGTRLVSLHNGNCFVAFHLAAIFA